MLEEHCSYVADVVRVERFRAAVARLVAPGSVVADLGCGSGILGLLCLEGGAGRVIAIDSTPMLEVARRTLARAGFGDRAAFVGGHSRRIALTESVDLLICDHVGFFGFDYNIVDTLQDARARFLKPGGRQIPSRIRLRTAAVESEDCCAKVEGWRAAGVPAQFHWLREHAVNTRHAVELTGEALLGEPAELGDIDLLVDNPEYFSWSAELRIARDGLMHGLGGWFECELADGVWMTNSPLAERPIKRAQAFLPIEEPVALRTGDVVNARIMARPAENLLAWVVEIPAAGKRFVHSTWNALPLRREDLLRLVPDRLPRPNREAAARSVVLGYCDGRRTVAEIGQAVLHDHPDLFPSHAEITRFVAQVLGQDTE